MRFLKYLALLSILLCLPAVSAHAQVAVGVGVAPYGYGYGGYDYGPPACDRSEEHTSELQSLRHLVCRLLLEKKKIKRMEILMRAFDEDSVVVVVRVLR